MTVARCHACGIELNYRGACHAEVFSPMVDRVGRHVGLCWGGLFPQGDESPERVVVRTRRTFPPITRERPPQQLTFGLDYPWPEASERRPTIYKNGRRFQWPV